MSDVVVIGGGIEGYAAALSALKTDPSASVRVLRRDVDRFETETGLIDVLGYEPDGSGPVKNPLSAIDRLSDSHLYSHLGIETVQKALALFDDATGERYAGAETETNALLPTAIGRFAPAVRYPQSMANGVLSGADSMRLVGFEEVVDFDAELAANRLNGTTTLDVTGRTIAAPLSAEDGMAGLARQLDTNESVDGQPAREAFAEAVEPMLNVEPRLGLPAVLGEEETAAILDTLAQELYVSVFEVALGPPSLPGQRLERLLADAVESRGGTLDQAAEIDAERSDGQIEAVRADGERYEAETYVLATGGAESGGVVGGPDGLGEPVVSCPVSLPGKKLVDEQFLGDHPAVRAGVETNEALQPTTNGSPVAKNLYAAGRVLESPNLIADHAAGGFALVTGYAAGRRAAENS